MTNRIIPAAVNFAQKSSLQNRGHVFPRVTQWHLEGWKVSLFQYRKKRESIIWSTGKQIRCANLCDAIRPSFLIEEALKQQELNRCVWSPNTEIITNVTHHMVLHLTPLEYGIGSRVGHINTWVRLMKIPPTCMPRTSPLRPHSISHASKDKATKSGVVQEYLYDVVFGSRWAVSRALVYNIKWQVSIPALAVEYFIGQLHRHLLLQLSFWGNCSAF